MALKLFAHPLSCNSRKVHWLLTELNADYEYETVDLMQGAQKGPEFSTLNPLQRVPVLVSNDKTLAESNAILLSLAQSHGKLMGAPDTQQETLQWLFWQSSDLADQMLQPWLMKIYDRFGVQPLDQPAYQAAVQKTEKPLAALEQHLSGRHFIAGDEFTIADVAVAESFGLAEEAEIPTDSYPNIQSWFAPLTAREAWQRTRPK